MAPIPVWPGEFVSLGDTQVYVRTAPATGSATTDANPAEQVVCVHGFGGSANNWTDLMALLSGATRQESQDGQNHTSAPALSPGDPVTILRRTRLADKRPVVTSTEILPARLFTPADAAALTHAHQSLYAYLYRHRGIAIYRGLAELTPVKATAELAAALDVPRGGLLLCISQVDYDDTGKAVMYSIEHHLPDWVRFTVERIGPGSALDD